MNTWKSARAPAERPSWKPGSIFIYILGPVIIAAVLIGILAIGSISRSIYSHFEGIARSDIDLASKLAYAECEGQFNDLLALRLSDNPMMVSSMRYEAKNLVLAVAEHFSNIQMFLVDQKGRVISGSSSFFISGQSLPLPERGDETIHILEVQGRQVALQARYFPFWHWYIVSLITMEDIQQPVRHIRYSIALALSLVLFLLILAVLITLHMALKRPLNTMIEALSEISVGNFRRIENTRRDEVGRITGAINSMSESLERQQQELEISIREKSVLLQEIHHRVKNNLNVVVSLLNLQSDQIESPEDARKALANSCNRIYAMALVHEKLYRSESLSNIDLKSYVDSITGQLVNIYGEGKNIELDLNVEDVFLDISIAMPCGLIINELCTNSLIHAFQDRDRGKISLSFRKNKEDFWELDYHDDGVGLPAGSDAVDASKSLGMMLINILSEQLSGEAVCQNNEGFRFILKIPKKP